MDLKILAIAIAVAAVSGCTAMSSYTGSLFSTDAFSIEYPGSWNTSSAAFLSAVFSDVGRNTTFTVSNTTMTIDEAASRARELESQLKDYTLIKEEETTLNGNRAFSRIYRWQDAAHKINITQMQVWTQGKNITYQLIGTAPESDFPDYEPVFRKMVESFQEK